MSANRTNIGAEPGKQEILITREFDAPRALVFKAYTDPTLIPQWWGPRYLSTEVDKMDVMPGGQWRFINRDAEGNEYAFHGVYHEVLAPERVIDTFEFEELPETGHVALETMKLEELHVILRKTVQGGIGEGRPDRAAEGGIGQLDRFIDRRLNRRWRGNHKLDSKVT